MLGITFVGTINHHSCKSVQLVVKIRALLKQKNTFPKDLLSNSKGRN